MILMWLVIYLCERKCKFKLLNIKRVLSNLYSKTVTSHRNTVSELSVWNVLTQIKAISEEFRVRLKYKVPTMIPKIENGKLIRSNLENGRADSVAEILFNS